jgi:hypothetical protein
MMEPTDEEEIRLRRLRISRILLKKARRPHHRQHAQHQGSPAPPSYYRELLKMARDEHKRNKELVEKEIDRIKKDEEHNAKIVEFYETATQLNLLKIECLRLELEAARLRVERERLERGQTMPRQIYLL